MDELARKGIEIKQQTLHDKIQTLVTGKGQVSNSGNPEEPQPYIVPEELQLYTVWKVFKMPEEQMKYPVIASVELSLQGTFLLYILANKITFIVALIIGSLEPHAQGAFLLYILANKIMTLTTFH